VRRLLILVTVASGTTGALFACSSTAPSPAAPPAVDGGDADRADAGDLDAGRADSEADADGGDEDYVVPDASVVCETSPCVIGIAGSWDGYCAILSDGRAACWGANDSGQLGKDPETSSVTTPSLVEGLTDVVELATNIENTCARTGDGTVYCWGQAALVHMGTAADASEPPFGVITTPTREAAVPPANSITVGGGFACVTVSDGSLSCWGTNERRELGRGTSEQSMLPPARATLVTRSAATAIGGLGRTFVIATDGSVLSWGANTAFGANNYLLGRDTSEDPNERPTLVRLLARVRDISTAFSHSCGVAGRFVECWGSNANGQLGRGTFEALSHLPGRTILADVTDDEDVDASTTGHDVPVQVVTGQAHSCAVLGSGRVYCWGSAGAGRVLGTQVNVGAVQGRPTRIDGFSGPVVRLAAGNGGGCALLRTGAVECWGSNDRGQLGMGSIDITPHPAPIRLTFPQ